MALVSLRKSQNSSTLTDRLDKALIALVAPSWGVARLILCCWCRVVQIQAVERLPRRVGRRGA